ncbi:GNAT family N-acetyltransferase [Planococcus lenghuensis]|uniref:GNAT family N-acetyltransferase n=1 Tax=Planococcus lenghuensis TaxID=2213202 RepID=A0A1Q2KZQ2_9BACL|nr:GNAT family N-acetyltransferase [Planococcus lenghuensis]AQQ53297.1 GNAT family N-acetyltransferase [Planococcus lenghuensis]
MKIRKAVQQDAKGIAKVHVDTWRAAYRSIVPDEYLDRLTYGKREKLWERSIPSGNVFIAVDSGGTIVGFADGGKERTGEYPDYAGELYAIYVLPECQSGGVGKSLFKKLEADLAEQGFSSMLVWVLADNPACRFYEQLRGVDVDRKTIEIGGKPLAERAYGWQQIGSGEPG